MWRISSHSSSPFYRSILLAGRSISPGRSARLQLITRSLADSGVENPSSHVSTASVRIDFIQPGAFVWTTTKPHYLIAKHIRYGVNDNHHNAMFAKNCKNDELCNYELTGKSRAISNVASDLLLKKCFRGLGLTRTYGLDNDIGRGIAAEQHSTARGSRSPL